MSAIRNYAVVTLFYWGFTVTDGALRMLVLLYFHTLGYTPLQLAFLFLFYEFFGVITNLFGGWIASRMGLKFTLFSGIILQIVALLALSNIDNDWELTFSVIYVMATQALSGIAKDLTKMSSKSALKVVVPKESDGLLFQWVSLLTGSKNALKGVGFFLGGFLLSILGFVPSLYAMAAGLTIVLFIAVLSLPSEMGKAKSKPPFSTIFSKSKEINILSAARFFLFCSRDVWFVVGVPLYLMTKLAWSFEEIGAFLALWVIGYGIVQSMTPLLLKKLGKTPTGRSAAIWCFLLAFIPIGIIIAIYMEIDASIVIIAGLIIFGLFFAINSAIHSFLILDYSDGDKVALNVGFYYMANAGGRLLGTLLSGLLYQISGVEGCLVLSGILLFFSALVAFRLPKEHNSSGSK
ncbi:MAG: organoarsenical effux MFS transporter ArsJ [Nitrospinae bacterium]|nr:organoarsenical effux MFS transporter ArsJ [Nitrospinota bacterium]